MTNGGFPSNSSGPGTPVINITDKVIDVFLEAWSGNGCPDADEETLTRVRELACGVYVRLEGRRDRGEGPDPGLSQALARGLLAKARITDRLRSGPRVAQ